MLAQLCAKKLLENQDDPDRFLLQIRGAVPEGVYDLLQDEVTTRRWLDEIGRQLIRSVSFNGEVWDNPFTENTFGRSPANPDEENGWNSQNGKKPRVNGRKYKPLPFSFKVGPPTEIPRLAKIKQSRRKHK